MAAGSTANCCSNEPSREEQRPTVALVGGVQVGHHGRPYLALESLRAVARGHGAHCEGGVIHSRGAGHECALGVERQHPAVVHERGARGIVVGSVGIERDAARDVAEERRALIGVGEDASGERAARKGDRSRRGEDEFSDFHVCDNLVCAGIVSRHPPQGVDGLTAAIEADAKMNDYFRSSKNMWPIGPSGYEQTSASGVKGLFCGENARKIF